MQCPPLAMAVPSFEELLIQWKIDGSTLEEPFSNSHILDFATKLDGWEILANFVGIPPSNIDSIKAAQGAAELQPMKMLECWKRRRGSKATYGAMIQALLQIKRTDLAEYIIELIKARKHVTLVAQEVEQVKLTLEELEREFFDLVVCTEATLTKFWNQEHLDKIMRRFRMLPESIKKQYRTDGNYLMTRRRILASSTIKELFDNLTELKYWSYMSPEILTYILQDVKIDDVKIDRDMHQKIEKYTRKVAKFKASTS